MQASALRTAFQAQSSHTLLSASAAQLLKVWDMRMAKVSLHASLP
jgi:hypothetical protein